MKSGSRRAALDTLISLSDVVLMTEEEAVEVTGLADPQAAAEAVLARPNCKTEWCVVKLGGEGALLVTKTPQVEVYRAGAFKVGGAAAAAAAPTSVLAAEVAKGKALVYQQQLVACMRVLSV
jgi:sugar/nucleoside kinase (ribokinase family)